MAPAVSVEAGSLRGINVRRFHFGRRGMKKGKAANYVGQLRRLYTGVVADALDAEGFRDQVMAHTVRPLAPEMVVCGTARTVLCAPVFAASGEPYAQEIRAVDSLQPLEVLAVTTGGVTTASFWGELLSTAAVARGAAGVVIDGFTRDARQILAMGFPVFATGFHPGDSLGRMDVIGVNVPIRCGGVLVEPGDYILGDLDGVVVVPARAISTVLLAAQRKVEEEDRVREELRAGTKVSDTFERHRVL